MERGLLLLTVQVSVGSFSQARMQCSVSEREYNGESFRSIFLVQEYQDHELYWMDQLNVAILSVQSFYFLGSLILTLSVIHNLQATIPLHKNSSVGNTLNQNSCANHMTGNII